MTDLVPAAQIPPAQSLLAPLLDPAGGRPLERLRAFTDQASVQRMLPWFLGVSALGVSALIWAVLSPAPQRVLYSALDDADRASVVDALDKASIAYSIDNATGTLTVNEDDLYRARMLVAQDGALSAPENGAQMLDDLPMGASRTLEGERLQAARERELVLTIQEIDGVEAARIHLAEGEKSVFVRENAPPTASVMVRLARGRQLSDGQVAAIVNLVAGSVPGLSVDAVRVADQHGKLLSEARSADTDRLELQSRMEDKLRRQVTGLLAPMLGEGNFTSEIQVELDMDDVTSATENYNPQGAVRTETQAQSSAPALPPAIGVPGALSNTPPPTVTARAGPPVGTPPPGQPGVSGEASSSRTYELGREVAVSNRRPGKLKRLSVAVALSSGAVKGKPADIEQIRQLVSAAVGADPQRGDQVAVVSRSFQQSADEAVPLWNEPWFGSVARSVAALVAVMLVLLLGVRPLFKALRRDPPAADVAALPEPIDLPLPSNSPEMLHRQLGFAQKLVADRPEAAVAALRQMLANTHNGATA
jgi:flagellar M-ring protein FliF